MVYGAVAAAFAVIVIAVAYQTSAPSLGVADFSPSAQKQLESPPTTSGSATGSGGSGGRRSTTTTQAPTTTAPDASAPGGVPTTIRPRGRECFGNPPRQVEDPQSPPCIPTIFEGDNGGATATGVTGTEIFVAVPFISYYEGSKTVVTALVDYFNRHFEFYGRRLRPVFVPASSFGDPKSARALATTIAGGGVFSSMTANVLELNWGAHPAFYQELARQKVITMAMGPKTQLLTDQTLFDDLHPYLWSVYPSVEDQLRNVSDFACTALVDRPAIHATGDLKGANRKFGIIGADSFGVPSASVLRSNFAACGIDAPVTSLVNVSSTDQRTALQKMEDAGVTTVVCVCAQSNWGTLMNTARNSLSYTPEWMPVAFGESDDYLGSWFGPEVLKNSMFVTPMNKSLPLQARPAFGAVQEMLGSLEPGNTLVGDALTFGETAYAQLMIIAAGIQGAGPTLTPDTFAAALMGTQFSNPGAGQPPYYQASVGFGPGDHSFVEDYALGWWSATATVDNPGAPANKGFWCYLGGGARFQVGRYPADAAARLHSATEPCR